MAQGVQVDLSGQIGVVTGGAGGLGLGIARHLAENGAKPVLWDADAAGLEKALATLPDAVGITLDICDHEAVERAVAETQEKVGPISILVNSAGIAGPTATLADYPVDAWHRVIDINLNGTFHVNRAVVKGMQERNYGRIVNIASIAGKEGNPEASAYSASKAGVIGLTKSLGKELAGFDIAVNALTPAVAKTPILEQVSEEFAQFMLSKIPRGRFLQVEEVADMVLWMVSRENSFTTGAVFDLSGGRATY